MKSHLVYIGLLTALLQGSISPAVAQPDNRRIRSPLIATGWDSPNPRQFREGLTTFEGWGVFDGTTLRATRQTADNAEAAAINAFSDETWAWSEFAGALADLQAAKPTTSRDNYLMLYSNPGDVDWFDDAGWRAIVEHWRLLARLAKQGGLSGLLFDAEPYTKPHSQFLYRAQPECDRHTFAEYRAKARQRGREVMTAVAAEFPDVSIFSYRLFSDMLGLLDSGNLELALEPHTYGLLPAFVDGWLDVMPPTVRIIEGTEDIGYRANSPRPTTVPSPGSSCGCRSSPRRNTASRWSVSSASARVCIWMPTSIHPTTRGTSTDWAAPPPAGSPPTSPRRWRPATGSCGSTARKLGGGRRATRSTRCGRSACPAPSAPFSAPGIPSLSPANCFSGKRPHLNCCPTATLPLPPLPTDHPKTGGNGRRRIPTARCAASMAKSNCAGCSTASSVTPPGWIRGTTTPCVSARNPRDAGSPNSASAGRRPRASGPLMPGTGSLSVPARRARQGMHEIVGLVQVPPEAGQMVFMLSVTGQLSEADRCWFDDAQAIDAGP